MAVQLGYLHYPFASETYINAFGIPKALSDAKFHRLGMLPNYALALGAKLVPIDVGMKHRLDIWLTYHPDLRNSYPHMRLWTGFAKLSMGGDFRVSMKNSSTHSI